MQCRRDERMHEYTPARGSACGATAYLAFQYRYLNVQQEKYLLQCHGTKKIVPTSPRAGSTMFSLELFEYCRIKLCIRAVYLGSSGLPHTRIASGDAFWRSIVRL